MKLALEALENIQADFPCDSGAKRIAAIKEALAQPEQESVAMADYINLMEKYVALKAAQRTWIKTLDQLPAHGQRVLALEKNADLPHTATFFTEAWVTSAGYYVKNMADTYDLWQPVPTRSNT